MLPDFKTWRETGTPYANFASDSAFPDANIQGFGHKQKSANWFKSPPKLHGTPPPPRKLKANEATEEPYWEVYLDNDKVKSLANKAKDLLKDSCPNSESYLVVKFHANRADLSIAKELLSKEFKVVEVEDES